MSHILRIRSTGLQNIRHDLPNIFFCQENFHKSFSAKRPVITGLLLVDDLPHVFCCQKTFPKSPILWRTSTGLLLSQDLPRVFCCQKTFPKSYILWRPSTGLLLSEDLPRVFHCQIPSTVFSLQKTFHMSSIFRRTPWVYYSQKTLYKSAIVRIPSLGFLFAKDLPQVFNCQKTFLKFSIVRRPSTGPLIQKNFQSILSSETFHNVFFWKNTFNRSFIVHWSSTCLRACYFRGNLTVPQLSEGRPQILQQK